MVKIEAYNKSLKIVISAEKFYISKAFLNKKYPEQVKYMINMLKIQIANCLITVYYLNTSKKHTNDLSALFLQYMSNMNKMNPNRRFHILVGDPNVPKLRVRESEAMSFRVDFLFRASKYFIKGLHELSFGQVNWVTGKCEVFKSFVHIEEKMW